MAQQLPDDLLRQHERAQVTLQKPQEDFVIPGLGSLFYFGFNLAQDHVIKTLQNSDQEINSKPRQETIAHVP